MTQTKIIRLLTASTIAIALLMFSMAFAFNNEKAEASPCIPTCLIWDGYFENQIKDIRYGLTCWQYCWSPTHETEDGYDWDDMGKTVHCTSGIGGCDKMVCAIWIQEPTFKCSLVAPPEPDTLP